MTRKHSLLMLACCLVPIAAIIMIGVFSIPITTLTQIVIVLLCPLMMFFMMRGMHDDKHHDQVTSEESQR